MENCFDADCNLCCRCGDRHVSHRPRDKLRNAAERAAAGGSFCAGRLGRASLRLTPEQDQKLRPIVRQADDELRNLYALNLRETNGILDRAQDRMSPILQPDQRAKLQKLIEERERRIEQWFTLPASPLP